MNTDDVSGTSPCGDTEASLAELALGILPGDGRGRVLAHLEGCERCRVEAEGLTTTADALLHLGPEIEPPFGLEVRLFDRLGDSVPNPGLNVARRRMGRSCYPRPRPASSRTQQDSTGAQPCPLLPVGALRATSMTCCFVETAWSRYVISIRSQRRGRRFESVHLHRKAQVRGLKVDRRGELANQRAARKYPSTFVDMVTLLRRALARTRCPIQLARGLPTGGQREEPLPLRTAPFATRP
jgi:hypothetical protein